MAGCNIVLMKRFLPLFILTGLLFGQDVLHLKSGKLKKGVFVEKLDNDIVFQIEGENFYTWFPIDKVEIIDTNNRKYYYPFNIPNKTSYIAHPLPLNRCKCSRSPT